MLSFTRTRELVQEGGASSLLHRPRMRTAISIYTQPAAPIREGTFRCNPPRPACQHPASTILNRLIHFATPKSVCADHYAGLSCTRTCCEREHAVRHPNLERRMRSAGRVPGKFQRMIAVKLPESRALVVKSPSKDRGPSRFGGGGRFQQVNSAIGEVRCRSNNSEYSTIQHLRVQTSRDRRGAYDAGYRGGLRAEGGDVRRQLKSPEQARPTQTRIGVTGSISR